MGVEAAVGPHGEWSGGSGMAYPSHRLTQEVGGASGRVGAALAQPSHQHVTGASGDGHQRVIAPLAGIAVVARPLLAQPVGLADGGVQVDGQRRVARSGPGGPRPCQQLAAHPIQLADMPPPEAAQEGPQGGRRLDHAAQGPAVPPVRNTSASSMQSSPASADATRDIRILSPALARPGARPKSTWRSDSSPRPRRWASVTGRSSPALATRR